MYNKHIVTLLVSFFILQYSYAQISTFSPYSRYGIGDIVKTMNTRTLGMGGVSYTQNYLDNINFDNPVGTSNIDSLTFLFDLGFNACLNSQSITIPTSKSSLKTNYQLSHASIGFALTKWWKMSIGFMPYSNVNYKINTTDSILNVVKHHKFIGGGGLNKVVLNNSFKIYKGLDIGVNFIYLFGKIYNSKAITFDDKNGEYVNFLSQTSTNVSDLSFDIAAKYTYQFNNNAISIAAIYGHNPKLNAYQNIISVNGLSSSSTKIIDTLYNLDKVKGKVGLPRKYGVGICYTINNKFYIGADYTMLEWNDVEFFGICDSLKNSTSFSLGCEYVENKRSEQAFKYSQTVRYRAGLYFNRNYFKLATTQVPINDFGISFGVGLPLKRSKSSLNLSAQYGQRGKHENALVKENYFVLGISFTIAETWFIKNRID